VPRRLVASAKHIDSFRSLCAYLKDIWLSMLSQSFEAADKSSADVERRAGPSETADVCFTSLNINICSAGRQQSVSLGHLGKW